MVNNGPSATSPPILSSRLRAAKWSLPQSRKGSSPIVQWNALLWLLRPHPTWRTLAALPAKLVPPDTILLWGASMKIALFFSRITKRSITLRICRSSHSTLFLNFFKLTDNMDIWPYSSIATTVCTHSQLTATTSDVPFYFPSWRLLGSRCLWFCGPNTTMWVWSRYISLINAFTPYIAI